MAITVSQLISDVQFLIDDSSVPTSTQLLRLLNRARHDIAKRVMMEGEVSFSSTQYAYKYTLPNDCWAVKNVMFNRIDDNDRVDNISIKDWNELDLSETGTYYEKYTTQAKTLLMAPRLEDGADTTKLDGSIGAGDTTITVDDTSYFKTCGVVIIDSEKIYYSNKTSTTLTGCTRAWEGTTAAIHLDNATVTEMDITITYLKQPTDNLTASDSLEEEFSPWHDVFAYWMAWQAKIKDTDDISPSGADRQAMMFRQLYEESVAVMTNEKYTKDDPIVIRDIQ